MDAIFSTVIFNINKVWVLGAGVVTIYISQLFAKKVNPQVTRCWSLDIIY